MDFSDILVELKKGFKAKRTGWNGKDQWIEVQFPDAMSKMTERYIYIKNQQGGRIPWFPSQGDLFAEDWVILV